MMAKKLWSTKQAVKSYESFVKEKEDQVLYLCRWNGNEIVEVHTKETLFENYKDTNLYDREYELYNYTLLKSNYDMYLQEYLNISTTHEDFLNHDFTLDNFTIRRIQ